MRALMLIVAIWMASGCSKTPVAPKGETAGMLPLQIGNQWILQRTYFDSLGTVIHIDAPDTTTIIADTLIDGQRWHYRHYLGHLLAYRNTESGTHTRLVSANTDEVVKLLFKYPAAVGDTYTYPIVFFNGASAYLVDSLFHCTVLSIDTAITVPAGTFRCHQYRVVRVGYATWFDMFVAPGVGWIKSDGYSQFFTWSRIFKVNSTETIRVTLH